MMIAVTCLEDIMQAQLLQWQEQRWCIKAHCEVAANDFKALQRHWRHECRDIALGLSATQCCYACYDIDATVNMRAITEYVCKAMAERLDCTSTQVVFDLERHNLDPQRDKLHCFATTQAIISHYRQHCRRAGFRLHLLDSNINCLIRSIKQQHPDIAPQFVARERHSDGSFTETPAAAHTNACNYFVNCHKSALANTVHIDFTHGSLTTYGLALNDHIIRH